MWTRIEYQDNQALAALEPKWSMREPLSCVPCGRGARSARLLLEALPCTQGCIDLVEKSPTGIMRILDETCKKPGAAASGGDKGFCSSVADAHRRNDFFMDARGAGQKNFRSDEAFAVRHFAGDVCYVGRHAFLSAILPASPHSSRRGPARRNAHAAWRPARPLCTGSLRCSRHSSGSAADFVRRTTTPSTPTSFSS